MDKELLNKLAEKRLSLERKLAKKQVLSDEMHGKWAESEKEIFALKREVKDFYGHPAYLLRKRATIQQPV